MTMLKTNSHGIKLLEEQVEALSKLRSGSILCGGVGSGKTYTSLFFYLNFYKDKPLYVITTAKKRDSNDWLDEAKSIGIETLIVDSWNNIKNYRDVKDAFFIFDEQRVVGYGAWAKNFIRIAKNNKWILLSATPGDVWADYIPVFIANGFYKHKTDFADQHIEYNPFVRYPQIKKYHNTGKLLRHRKDTLVMMKSKRHTKRHKKDIYVNHDQALLDKVRDNRWNIYEDEPIKNVSEYTQVCRKIVNEDDDRQLAAKWVMDIHDKVIVFYNYNYELDILLKVCEDLGKEYRQWNGHKHEEIPDSNKWIYLVQYTAGAEGWNCTSTNVMLFFSLNHSYRILEQAEGRIDRMNTKYTDLEYFYLKSKSNIDKSIDRAVKNKKVFNQSAWARKELDNAGKSI